MRQQNERDDQWEGIHHSGKIGADARGRDMGIEEGTEKKLDVAEMRCAELRSRTR